MPRLLVQRHVTVLVVIGLVGASRQFKISLSLIAILANWNQVTREEHAKTVEDDARGTPIAIAERMDVDELVIILSGQVVRIDVILVHSAVDVIDQLRHVFGARRGTNKQISLLLASLRINKSRGTLMLSVHAWLVVRVLRAVAKQFVNSLDRIFRPWLGLEDKMIDCPGEGLDVLDYFATRANRRELVGLSALALEKLDCGLVLGATLLDRGGINCLAPENALAEIEGSQLVSAGVLDHVRSENDMADLGLDPCPDLLIQGSFRSRHFDDIAR